MRQFIRNLLAPRETERAIRTLAAALREASVGAERERCRADRVEKELKQLRWDNAYRERELVEARAVIDEQQQKLEEYAREERDRLADIGEGPLQEPDLVPVEARNASTEPRRKRETCGTCDGFMDCYEDSTDAQACAVWEPKR